jgi:hypothetical protein
MRKKHQHILWRGLGSGQTPEAQDGYCWGHWVPQSPPDCGTYLDGLGSETWTDQHALPPPVTKTAVSPVLISRGKPKGLKQLCGGSDQPQPP